MLVQEMYRIQNRLGWLPEAELRALAERCRVPLYRLEEVSSFFPHFRREPPPELEIKICRDMSCHLFGAPQILDAMRKFASDHKLDDTKVHIQGCSCLGRCDRAPVMMAETTRHEGNGHAGHCAHVYTAQNPAGAVKILEELVAGKTPQDQPDASYPQHATKPWEIDPYAGKPSEELYAAVRWYLNAAAESATATAASEAQRAAEVLKALETAGLLGMGGAGGRTYKKWQEVRDAKVTPKYVVCNGDESEPGTFKDREILLRAPHLVVEGVIMGGLVVGAERGIIYIRHEFHEQIHAVEQAIKWAEQLEICGPNILATGRSFKVEVFTSPGGYICGEQTALIEAIEDKRAEPRNRPPELQTNGLFDKPTLLNNVETLAWVPSILLRMKDDKRGEWFASQGVNGCKGRRFFSISGSLKRPGAYEVPIGITLRELIYDYAGGTIDDRPIKALALSGPSGGLLPRHVPVESLGRRWVEKMQLKPGSKFDLLEMKLDIPISREMGVMLGGGMVVYAEGCDILDEALACLEFYRNESCGKCVPCRLGSQKLVEMATDLKAGNIDAAALPVLQTNVQQLAETMRLTAICGLGTVAANPMTTLLTHYGDDVKRTIKGGAKSK